MFDFPIAELITPEEQVAVARCVAIMASRDGDVADSERHFVEELMGQMMLLPEERDQVRKEFQNPGNIVDAAAGVKHREARIFLYYQACCAAMADNELVAGEEEALEGEVPSLEAAPPPAIPPEASEPEARASLVGPARTAAMP